MLDYLFGKKPYVKQDSVQADVDVSLRPNRSLRQSPDHMLGFIFSNYRPLSLTCI